MLAIAIFLMLFGVVGLLICGALLVAALSRHLFEVDEASWR